jgi:DNA-directed RNA polymerase specialized sigma24 family protein
MSSSVLGKAVAASPEEVFVSKHAWLFRWAMHFCHNDRAASEDLVQECFVKLLLSWDKLQDVDNLEPVLYTYLKYAHLTELRKGKNNSFQNLVSIDFDTFFIQLRMAKEADQLELQNELRRIVNYLLWRKRSAKFASIFLLRFFHGYFPEEIERISIVTRHAVDLSLRYARQEIKAHLAKESAIHEISAPSLPDSENRHRTLAAHEFAEELRQTIFGSARDKCPPAEQVVARYDGKARRPLSSEMLSHLVGCRRCLDLASSACGLPPTSRRSPEDTLGSAPHMKRPGGKASTSSKQYVSRMIARGHSRLREIYDHHTSGFMLVVNGEILAVRDLNSRTALLKVDTHSIETLKLIEVISEQGVTLLTLPVLAIPPEAAPELTHNVRMSGERTIGLLVRFTLDGALIEVTYHDPLFAAQADTGSLAQLEAALSAEPSAERAFSPRVHAPERAPKVGRRLLERLKAILFPNSRTSLIFAGLLVAVAFSLLTFNSHQRGRARAGDLLRRAVSAENTPAGIGRDVVIHQQIAIRADKTLLTRDLYRDPQKRRRPRPQPLDADARRVRVKMEEARVTWDDPLSASDYKAWHDRLSNSRDSVQETGSDLLTVKTVSDDPSISDESLTMRAGDLHPVARRVEFRDRQVIEIAELSYSVAPWSKLSEEWFEADIALRPRTVPVAPVAIVHLPHVLSDDRLNEIQLQTMLVLKQLQADTERLLIERQPTGITVRGVVDTDERKRQIAAGLLTIPHVSSAISSYRDMDRLQPPATQTSGVTALSVTSDVSPMEQYCQDHHIDRDDCRRASYQLLNAATAIVRESNQIHDLQQEYSSSALTPDAKDILHALVSQDISNIRSAITQQQTALSSLHYTTPIPSETAPATEDSLIQAARINIGLSKALLYPEMNSHQSAESSLDELAHSFTLIRTSLLRLPGVLLSSSHDAQSEQTPQP